MDELLKALTPYPMVQGIAFGLIIAGIGAWAVKRGLQDSQKRDHADLTTQGVHIELTDAEKRLQWTAYEQLQNIESNSFASVKLLEKIAEALNRIADGRWNIKQ